MSLPIDVRPGVPGASLQPDFKESSNFNPLDLLKNDLDTYRDALDRVVKADGLLSKIHYLMLEYGTTKEKPDGFKWAKGIFEPGIYELDEVELKTSEGPVGVSVFAEYGDAPFYEGLGEIIAGGMSFELQTEDFTLRIPRTDFRDHYSSDHGFDDNSENTNDEEKEIRARADQLPSLDILTKAEYAMELIGRAYEKIPLAEDSDLLHTYEPR